MVVLHVTHNIKRSISWSQGTIGFFYVIFHSFFFCFFFCNIRIGPSGLYILSSYVTSFCFDQSVYNLLFLFLFLCYKKTCSALDVVKNLCTWKGIITCLCYFLILVNKMWLLVWIELVSSLDGPNVI